MGECAQGAFGRLAIKQGTGSLDYSSGASRLAFFREGMRTRNQIIHPDVITGDRFEHKERARKAPNLHYGPVLLPVTPGDLTALLPAITGGSFSGSDITLGSSISPYGYLFDKNPNLTNPYQWHDAYVDKARFFGRQHGPGGPPNWFVLELWLLAKTKVRGTTWPVGLSFSTGAEYSPFIFEDLTLTLAGVAREVSEIMIEIDNHLDPRYVNSLDPTQICSGKVTVRQVTTHPADSDTDDLENMALAGIASVAAFTNGTIGTTFTAGNLKAPDDSPVIRGKTEIKLTLEGALYMSGSTNPLTITNDATP